MQEIECNIKGRVQVVMFRDFATRKARKFGLRGYVKNLANKSVHVVAQGEKTKLENYIKLLKKGSLFSRVDSVQVLWREPNSLFESFSIMY